MTLDASLRMGPATPPQRRMLGWILVAASPFPVLVAALVAWKLGRPGTAVTGTLPFPPWMLVLPFAVGSLLSLGVGTLLLRGSWPGSSQAPSP
jgi:hypothetical protein